MENGTLEELVKRGVESEVLDYKSAMNWNLMSRPARAKIIRHCLAMANTKGGSVVIGVGEDQSGHPSDYQGLSDEEVHSFDPSTVGAFINRYVDPPIDFTIERPEIDGKRYYRTGDKGYLDEDGFLTIVDRYSRFAKLGGEMVSLGAVEKKIQDTQVLEGCDYVVTSIPDAAKGEKIVLVYQGEKDESTVVSELRSSGMPPLMIPSLAMNVEAVPKLGTGKADFTTAKKMVIEMLANKR